MAEWNVKNPINIDPTKDTLEVGFEKIVAELVTIYEYLNRLHRLDAGAGTSVTDAAPYSLRVDTATGRLLIRNADNTEYIDLGDVSKPSFGITAESIGAIERKGTSGGDMYFNNSGAAPDPADPDITLATNDLYFDMQNKRVYYWTGIDWQVLLSLNFGDMLDYERYTINRNEVAYSGADKVLRLDRETGKANVDITGSPDKLFDKLIDVQNLRDDQVLSYNAEKNKFVNRDRNEWTRDDASYTGETAGKLVLWGSDGAIRGDITGSANGIGGILVDLEALRRIADGQVLAFDEESGRFKPKDIDYIGPDDITETGEAGKVPRLNEDGKGVFDITGSPDKLADVKVNVNDIEDGDVLVYKSGSQTFVNEPKGSALGDARSLIVKNAGSVLTEYNGSQTKEIDLDFWGLGRNAALGRVQQMEIEMANVLLCIPKDNLSLVVSDREPVSRSIWLRPLTSAEEVYMGDVIPYVEHKTNMLLFNNLAGDRKGIDKIQAPVVAITAGNRAVGVTTLEGIHPGEWYTISDGVHSELVQVKSSGKNEGILRFTTKRDIINTYNQADTKVYRTTIDLDGMDVTGRGVIWHGGEELVLDGAEFMDDSRALAFASVLVRHDKLTAGEIKAYVKFQDEVKDRTNINIGVGTGERKTYVLPDRGPGIDYNSIRVFVNGVETTDFSANTETDLGEITLTAPVGYSVSASYSYDYQDEVWQEMEKAAVENYGDSNEVSTKFEYLLPEGRTAKTRTAIKLRYEATGTEGTVLYTANPLWAKAKDYAGSDAG